MFKSTGSTSKEGNIYITTSNSYVALVNDEYGEYVANVNEKSANLCMNPNTGGSSSFTVAAG